MNQKTAIVALGMSLVLLIVAVSGGMILPLSDQGKDHSSAPEHSPVISEQFDIERVDFIHYAKPTGPAKPAPPAPTCYKLMGIKWKQLPVSYTINTVNTEGLSPDQVNSTLSTSAETWDSDTTRELFSDSFKTANVAYRNPGQQERDRFRPILRIQCHCSHVGMVLKSHQRDRRVRHALQ